jgi:hypothetical protein
VVLGAPLARGWRYSRSTSGWPLTGKMLAVELAIRELVSLYQVPQSVM